MILGQLKMVEHQANRRSLMPRSQGRINQSITSMSLWMTEIADLRSYRMSDNIFEKQSLLQRYFWLSWLVGFEAEWWLFGSVLVHCLAGHFLLMFEGKGFYVGGGLCLGGNQGMPAHPRNQLWRSSHRYQLLWTCTLLTWWWSTGDNLVGNEPIWTGQNKIAAYMYVVSSIARTT